LTRLIQVTDPHIGASADYRLAGVDTRRTFAEVMEQVRLEEPDILMMTGDNAADYSADAYRHFFSVMATFSQPWYWLPGNHDKVATAESVEGARPFQRLVDLEHWRIILLDSVVPRSPNGELGEDELNFLAAALAEPGHRHLAIFLHHHPVDINCAWLDTQRVADADRFFALVDSCPAVRGIFWGHIHQEFNAERQGVRLHSCPSTCIQFLPDSDDFALDLIAPGYRVIELRDNGEINTYVRRVEMPDIGVDLSCIGYD
jgi:3',5'-cyclic-AMP phosphodiesterase